jgi:hypothetical protein
MIMEKEVMDADEFKKSYEESKQSIGASPKETVSV